MKKLILMAFALCMTTAAMLPYETNAATVAAAAPDAYTTTVVRTVCKGAVKKNQTDKGTFTYKKGGTMSMVFSETDKLLMEGKTYTLVSGKRSSVAKGETAMLFGVMQKVVDNILSGGNGKVQKADTDAAVITYNGNTITIEPAEGVKASRLLFKSFVITADLKQHKLLGIRMNGKGKNYTTYEFGK
ncbi:MAG: hypothetical protein HUK08_03405 [Bacteroidaceae bacterium]|nr:hypothetical protein [Bacteroidaceae bacterium]